jgi:hypothetical protein
MPVREQKAALLKAVRPLDVAHVVRGQYASYRSRADRDYRMSSVLKLMACLATRKGTVVVNLPDVSVVP